MTDTEAAARDRQRLARAVASLEGLATGDAFGETFFDNESDAVWRIHHRTLKPGPWHWTDDTAMALSVVAILSAGDAGDLDDLAAGFGLRYRLEPDRGYGPAMHGLLPRYVLGHEWQTLAKALFRGEGSFGNGAAMRVAPVGAYFADHLERALGASYASATVTHAHIEGIAGARAVAVAAAFACRPLLGHPAPEGDEFLDLVATYTPESTVKHGIRTAATLGPGMPVGAVAATLGSGQHVTAQDTVPFALWCAAHHLDDFEHALWQTVAGLGDRDTTCAIVGGILGARVGVDGIPAEWRRRREALPPWVARLTWTQPADESFSLDADPANANWLRIVGAGRDYEAGKLSADAYRERVSRLAERPPECIVLPSTREGDTRGSGAEDPG